VQIARIGSSLVTLESEVISVVQAGKSGPAMPARRLHAEVCALYQRERSKKKRGL